MARPRTVPGREPDHSKMVARVHGGPLGWPRRPQSREEARQNFWATPLEGVWNTSHHFQRLEAARFGVQLQRTAQW